MKWQQTTPLAVLFLLPGGCTGPSGLQTHPEPVSIFELRTSPSKYEGMVVAVAGYLNHRENRLFLTKEHRGIEDWTSSIPIGISYKNEEREAAKYPRTGCGEKFVVLYGVWDEHWARGMENWPDKFILRDVYQIDKMKRVEDWGRGPPRLSCWHNTAADPISDVMRERHAIR